MKKVFIATAPAPGEIPGRNENEMFTNKFFRDYSDLVNYVESYPRRLSRYDVVNILVGRNGSVDELDLIHIGRLYLDMFIDD